MVFSLSTAAMPYHHQQKDSPDDSHCTKHGAERQSRAPGTTNAGFDPALFALTTALPMSCFPVDNVHLSERYGATKQKRNLARSNTYHDSTCGNVTTPFPLHLETRCSCKCRMHDESIFDAMPPLSASTASSGWQLNWPSNKHITDLGNAGTFDATLQSGGHVDFGLLGSYSTAPCNAEMSAGNFATVVHDRSEYGWNEPASCYAGTLPQQSLGSVNSQMPCDPIWSVPPINHSADKLYDGNALLPAPGLLPACSLLQHHTSNPPLTGRMTPEYSPDHIDQEVIDFLDKLADTINWDDIELRNEHLEPNHTLMADSERTTGFLSVPFPGYHQHQNQQLHAYVPPTLPGLWVPEIQAATAGWSPSLAEWLDAVPCDYRMRSPSPFQL
jgi:hypothetical protein